MLRPPEHKYLSVEDSCKFGTGRGWDSLQEIGRLVWRETQVDADIRLTFRAHGTQAYRVRKSTRRPAGSWAGDTRLPTITPLIHTVDFPEWVVITSSHHRAACGGVEH